MYSEKSDEPVQPKSFPAEVFLDTSIHIARLKGQAIKERVDDFLSKSQWRGTSTYAKLEYGNNILHVASYLLDKIDEFDSLEDFRYFVTNQLIPRFSDHHQKHVWFSDLLSQHFNKPEAKEKAKRTLRHILRIGTTFVSDLCDETRDQIGCIWTDQRGNRRWKKPHDCHRYKPGCRIDRFFSENRSLFGQIRDIIRTVPKNELTAELERFAVTIDKACADPQVLRHYENCRALADAIIAVQSNGYLSFFTQNVRESRVLCRALCQLLIGLPQNLQDPMIYSDYRPARQEGHNA